MVKSGGTAERRFSTFAGKRIMANFLDPGIPHFGKITYRLTHHSPSFAGNGESFRVYPKYEAATGTIHPHELSERSAEANGDD